MSSDSVTCWCGKRATHVNPPNGVRSRVDLVCTDHIEDGYDVLHPAVRADALVIGARYADNETAYAIVRGRSSVIVHERSRVRVLWELADGRTTWEDYAPSDVFTPLDGDA